MELTEYKNIFDHEESHFLYSTRHNLIISLIKRYISPNKKHINILDAGCGTGLLAKKLERFGQVWAIDIHPEAIKFSKLRGVNVTKASVINMPFKSNNFDLVISVDVIYHSAVKSDQKALNEFFRVLKPGGILVIRVPGNKWFHLAHDKHVFTRQRYDKGELRAKLVKAGFGIEKLSFVNALLFPLAILQQAWEMINPPRKIQSGVQTLPKLVNDILSMLLSLEISLIEKVDLPFGIGLIAVCRKR